MELVVFFCTNIWAVHLLCVFTYVTLYALCGPAVTTTAAIIHGSFPILFKYSKHFRCRMTFYNFVQWPPFLNHKNLKNFGIDGGRNIVIRHLSKVDNCKVDIGIWHILPMSSYRKQKWCIEQATTKSEIDQIFKAEFVQTDKPIFLYLHGNTQSRAFKHRIALYKVLQELDVHVVAFDYRGFGDSTNILPTKPGMIEDSLVVYSWIRSLCGDKRLVYIWGHSMGSALVAKLLSKLDVYSTELLCLKNPLPPPTGVILEGLFYDIISMCLEFAPTAVLSWQPHYKKLVTKAFRDDTNVRLIPHKYVQELSHLPILQLHAVDDEIIPFRTGCEVHDLIKKNRNERPVLFETFNGTGHMWVCKDKRLPQIIRNFISLTN